MANHICGGTVLVGGTVNTETRHQYCDRCGAFTHDMDAALPSGTDKARNHEAWDAGRAQSPDDGTEGGTR